MNQNDNVTYLAGDRIKSTRPFAPYDELLCEFLNDLSAELRSYEESLIYPDIMAFAFWCRKANIAKLKTNFKNLSQFIELSVLKGTWKTNLLVRPEKDWEKDKGRSVV